MTKILVACSLMMAANAFAQQPSDTRADLGQNIKVGQNVTVQLTDGSELKGSVFELTQTQLALATKKGMERISAPRVREVSWRRPDGIWNGLLIGAAAGGLAGWAVNFANDCESNECGENANVPGGIVIGAAVGTVIDLLRHKREVLYRAPQNQTSLRFEIRVGQVRGAEVSWRF
jgi:hypothetical protein